ncbi:MAG TPA: hypothetical protein VNF68_09955 [Candidatus Baltobacteraceae bacterium]|nr:hypothetical protein [Candidatus Baltobacteraceae bacterium]
MAPLALLLLAAMPSLAVVDAHSRATGNRKDVAVAVGDRLFETEWPAQVLQVEANQMSTHLVLGVHVSGVKFHWPLTRAGFESEIRSLIAVAFAAAPNAEEVDVWVTVPIPVAKGVVVSGDLAKPTMRNVYTVSARRGRGAAKNAFVDEEWARAAFEKAN